MRRGVIFFLIAGAVLLFSCSNGSIISNDTKTNDAFVYDVKDVNIDKFSSESVSNIETEIKINDTKFDFDFSLPDDITYSDEESTETTWEWCESTGSFGCECQTNDDCKSGYCIPYKTGKICTTFCVDSCPEDFTCQSIKQTGPDTVTVCIYNYMNLCKPCNANSECIDLYDNDTRCVSFGENGSFCGTSCNDQSECPDGYECMEKTTVEGKNGKFCVPANGECECNSYFVEGGFKTTCYNQNEYGTCYGERVCTQNGLSECNASVPEPEKCDTIDNDCDGQTDENIENPPQDICPTKGVCEGTVKTKCIGGEWICIYDEVPNFEPGDETTCDGLDNDCDGETDENIEGVENSTCLKVGACKEGVIATCENGEWKCDYSQVQNFEEVEISCDGIDNDCDGETDENLGGDYCENSNEYGTCGGTYSCVNGKLVCTGKIPQPEECNGEDDNCDGQTDEGYKDTDSDGKADCIDEDDDNDGILDDGDNSGIIGDNFCTGGETTDCDDNCKNVANSDQKDLDYDGVGDACDNDKDGDGFKEEEDCDDMNKDINPNMEEACDGIDNNCNGQIDEGFNDNDGDGKADCIDEDDDNDGILDDGDGSGVVGDNPCTDGNAENCDDNCIITPNPDQKDSDGDGKGDLCDNDKDGDGDPDSTDCEPDNPEISHLAKEVCDGVDNNCDGAVDEENAENCTSYYEDFDKDGFGNAAKVKCLCAPEGTYTALEAGDCDDKDKNVNPSEAEKCDGKDNNCNGETDEENADGCQPYFYDNDLDGYGDPEKFKCLCEAHGKYSSLDGTDCDDNNGLVYPGAKEYCNDIDDDCDNFIDEEGAQGCDPYFLDMDGDGYGKSDNSKCLCKPNDLYSTKKDGDCNDNAKDAFPGNPEVCDGLDNDCNGIVDDEGAKDCETYYKDEDGDFFGLTDDKKCLCAPTGAYTAQQSGDCDDKDKTVFPGAPEVCNDKDDNCDGKVDEENAGGCIPYYYDLDGDGWGVPDQFKCLCKKEGLYTAEKFPDCNDSNKNINPDAEEICNNMDDDCDSLTDEEGAKNCTTYYMDQDKDNYGLSDNSKCLCKPQEPYTAIMDGDCNDTTKDAHPNALEKCDFIDNDCDGEVDEAGASGCKPYYKDADKDGYGIPSDFKCLCMPTYPYTSQKLTDCDDNDKKSFPGAQEVCDGKDNDCDNFTDEEGAAGCTPYFQDLDGDNHGNPQYQKCLCKPQTPYTATVGDDCNDASDKAYPGATEYCDYIDNDCDQQVDEEGAEDCNWYLKDADQDNYGVSNDKKCLCKPTAPYTATTGGDCNDSNKNVHPNVIENCSTSYDDNCNGSTNEENALNCKPYYYDGDGDKHANPYKSKCLCAPLGNYKYLTGDDCNDSDSSVYPGATEKCNGKDDDCDYQKDECDGNPDCKYYYKDGDGDGYGHPSDKKLLCSPTTPYTKLQGSSNYNNDCDDNSYSVHPGATEYCDSIDQDCDGSTDDGPQDKYESNNYWPGKKIANYENDDNHDELFPAIQANINPSGDNDWFYAYAKESYSDWCITDSQDEKMKCRVTLSNVPSGKSYKVCACWSKNGQCDITSMVCDYGSVQVNYKKMDCGHTDWGYCDIKVYPVSGWSCKNYSLQVHIWE